MDAILILYLIILSLIIIILVGSFAIAGKARRRVPNLGFGKTALIWFLSLFIPFLLWGLLTPILGTTIGILIAWVISIVLAPGKTNPNEKLVKVFEAEEESEALVVKGLLDSAGIDNDLTAAALVQDMFPGLGGMIILVREEDAERVRRLIAEQQQTPLADDDETAEIEPTEEPPPKP